LINNMADPIKILEITGDDWIKGNSAHAGLPVGGIFQTATEFDPFNLPGFLRASLSPTDVDTTTLSTEINALASGASGGVGYVVAIGNRASGGAKCAYLINTSSNAVTDQKANVDSSLLLNGVAIYGGYVIYADGSDAVIKSVTFPAFGSDTAIEIPTGMLVTNQPVTFAVGPSGYLHYFRGVENGEVGVITVPSSNHANNTGDSIIVQNNLTPKDGCSDGRYFAVIADNNATRAVGVNSDCKIFFTIPTFVAGAPTSTTSWEVAYPIPDHYLISARYVNGRIYVIGYSGIWECSIGQAPVLVQPLLSNQIPKNPYQVTVQKNVMIWGSSTAGALVYAYGNPLNGKPILYNPYDSTGGDGLHTALCSSGNYVYAGVDGTSGAVIRVVAHNWGATRANTTVQSVIQHMPQLYALAKVKISLKKPLASGESVSVTLFNGDDQTILTTSTRSFTTYGALRSMTFDPAPDAVPIANFENFYLQVTATGGAIVDTAQVWAIPQSPLTQTK
jgi:hypothetical protein